MSHITNLSELGITGAGIIAMTDSVLFIYQNYNSENPICGLTGSTIIAKGGSIGQGPEDVLEINSLNWNPADGLYIYDSQKGRICFYQIRDSSIVMTKAIDAPRLLDDAVVIKQAVVIFPNTTEYSAAIVDSDGLVVDSLMYFPPKPYGISPQVHALACTGFTAELPGGEFARCVAYDGGVDFYKVESGELSHINRFALFDMEYTQINQGMNVPVPSDKSKSGFIMVKSSADKFYASFSDKYALDNPEGLCDRIYQFSKNGELERIYVVECDFSDFTVDVDNSEIHILTDENENDIVRSYHIPE